MLEVSDLRASYGSLEALHGVSLRVAAGQSVAVVGANGAGKSTLVNAIMGEVQRCSGSVRLEGRELLGHPGHGRIRLGLALVPEGRRIFAPLTVRQNLRLGAYTLKDRSVIEDRIQSVVEMFPRLGERMGQAGGTLSGGEQQMLAIGRAMMSEPRVLLLDEPSLGLAPLVAELIFGALAELNRDRGLAVLLIEQNAAAALELADTAYVLELGSVTTSGPTAELADDPEIQRAYLRIDPEGDPADDRTEAR